MADYEDESATRHPVRELIYPDIEEPMLTAEVGENRRHMPRFSRYMPGLLDVEGDDHAVTCIDISFAGLRVTMTDAVDLTQGMHVRAKFRVGSRSFEDEYTVVGVRETLTGTTIHLSN